MFKIGICDEGFRRLAQAAQQQQGGPLQVVDVSPDAEDSVFYFSDGTIGVFIRNAINDPDEGQMWAVTFFTPDGNFIEDENLVNEVYGPVLTAAANTLPHREKEIPQDAQWISHAKTVGVPKVQAEWEEQKRQQHEQEGEQFSQDMPSNVRL